MQTDRIEKQTLLRASQSRVWRALSDSTEFGTWFGVRFDAPFKPGAEMLGFIQPSGANADLAKAQKQYADLPFHITIEEMVPERLFSFRWHPYATEKDYDYSAEPTTLVSFTLEKTTEGVLLTVTESGFDQIPLGRRAKAFTENEKGWSMVIKVVGEYLGSPEPVQR